MPLKFVGFTSQQRFRVLAFVSFYFHKQGLFIQMIDCDDIDLIFKTAFPVTADFGPLARQGQFFGKIFFQETAAVGGPIPRDERFEIGKISNLHRSLVFVQESEPEMQEIVFDFVFDKSTARFRKNGLHFPDDPVFRFQAVQVTPDVFLQDAFDFAAGSFGGCYQR